MKKITNTDDETKKFLQTVNFINHIIIGNKVGDQGVMNVLCTMKRFTIEHIMKKFMCPKCKRYDSGGFYIKKPNESFLVTSENAHSMTVHGTIDNIDSLIKFLDMKLDIDYNFPVIKTTPAYNPRESTSRIFKPQNPNHPCMRTSRVKKQQFKKHKYGSATLIDLNEVPENVELKKKYKLDCDLVIYHEKLIKTREVRYQDINLKTTHKYQTFTKAETPVYGTSHIFK